MSDTSIAAPDELHQYRVAFLCTLRPDGSPHQTPVWFVFVDQTWWIATAESNIKVRNVMADARVSIAVLSHPSPAVAEGLASIQQSDWPAEVVEAFAVKYRGWDVTDERPDGPRVLLQVATTRWLLSPT